MFCFIKMVDEIERWVDLDKVIMRGSPLAAEGFIPGDETKGILMQFARVLVIGAGGLGCEILKCLAMSGFRDIHVIDMNKIDVTNLNHQSLFRKENIGQFKAEIAARFVMARVPGTKVTAYIKMCQQYDDSFYRAFHLVIAGLNNIDARRWINSMLHSLVEFDPDGNVIPGTARPLIDGSTEGFRGQSRLILPFMTACNECTLGSPPLLMFNKCWSIRVPQHCIQYAYLIEWEKAFPTRLVDKNSPEDLHWLYEKAKEIASHYGIEGVDYMMTIGVIKNITPAIASTNALISASCAAEALKLATYSSKSISNCMSYNGQAGLHINTFVYKKDPNCQVCSQKPVVLEFSRYSTLKDFIEHTNEKFRLKNPGVSCASGNLYLPSPPSLEQRLHFKLDLTFSELISLEFYREGEELNISDVTLTDVKRIKVKFLD